MNRLDSTIHDAAATQNGTWKSIQQGHQLKLFSRSSTLKFYTLNSGLIHIQGNVGKAAFTHRTSEQKRMVYVQVSRMVWDFVIILWNWQTEIDSCLEILYGRKMLIWYWNFLENIMFSPVISSKKIRNQRNRMRTADIETFY